MQENTNQKAVTLEALAAAAPMIATKAEVAAVKKQVEDMQPGNVVYATTDEVLALFTEKAEGGDPSTGSDPSTGDTGSETGSDTPTE